MSSEPLIVSVSAVDGGHLTLPERLFVADADPDKRSTVPSLCFLIQHPSSDDVGSTYLLFDLGLKRDFSGYASAQRDHITQRQPTVVDPDCSESLRAGGLDPVRDIDVVILSHVHWDHVGTSSDFTGAIFVVGSGTLDVLRNGAGPLYPAELFNTDELPFERTWELPPVPSSGLEKRAAPKDRQIKQQWTKLGDFPAALDYFGDGSVWIIDAPGHLIGHVNLLARIGPSRWVYLGGDCCHDPRILRGEKGIALYEDGKGGMRSVHWSTTIARNTLDTIKAFVKSKRLDGEGELDVQAIVAHDKEWREANRDKFFPGTL